MPEDTNKNNTPWDRMTDRQNELQYHDVSTYLRAWYKGEKKRFPHRTWVWPRTTFQPRVQDGLYPPTHRLSTSSTRGGSRDAIWGRAEEGDATGGRGTYRLNYYYLLYSIPVPEEYSWRRVAAGGRRAASLCPPAAPVWSCRSIWWSMRSQLRDKSTNLCQESRKAYHSSHCAGNLTK